MCEYLASQGAFRGNRLSGVLLGKLALTDTFRRCLGADRHIRGLGWPLPGGVWVLTDTCVWVLTDTLGGWGGRSQEVSGC